MVIFAQETKALLIINQIIIIDIIIINIIMRKPDLCFFQILTLKIIHLNCMRSQCFYIKMISNICATC